MNEQQTLAAPTTRLRGPERLLEDGDFSAATRGACLNDAAAQVTAALALTSEVLGERLPAGAGLVALRHFAVHRALKVGVRARVEVGLDAAANGEAVLRARICDVADGATLVRFEATVFLPSGDGESLDDWPSGVLPI
jgi:hypothetical protein